jgi:hypothetical protein
VQLATKTTLLQVQVAKNTTLIDFSSVGGPEASAQSEVLRCRCRVTVGCGEEHSAGAVTTPAVSGTGVDRDPLGAAKVTINSELPAKFN